MSITDEDRSEISALEDAVDALRAQLAVVEVLENEAAGLRRRLAAVEKDRDEHREGADAWHDRAKAALAERDALRDRLAVVEKERDEYRGWFEGKCVCGSHAGDDNKCPAHGPQRLRIARDAALARVKALEAALDISDGAVLHSRWCRECAEGDPCADIADAVAQVSARARARAGLTKEGSDGLSSG